jgi:hypothetical protein
MKTHLACILLLGIGLLKIDEAQNLAVVAVEQFGGTVKYDDTVVPTENAIVADLLILVRPLCWRIASDESSALLPSGKYNRDAFR